MSFSDFSSKLITLVLTTDFILSRLYIGLSEHGM